MTGAIAFGCGLLFAVGLAVAGMTDPGRVIAFLDVAGAWNPSLALVMGAALAVYAVAWRLRPVPVPARRGVDGQLLAGAAIFGVGWGISGYCPGPAIASLAVTGAAPVFVAAMLAGMFAVERALKS